MKKVITSILVIVGALFVLILIAGVMAGSGAKTDNTTSSAKSSEATVPEITINSTASPVWQYSEQTDEMNGQKLKFAIVTSTNTVEFGPPYEGGSSFNFAVRKKGNKNEIYLQVDKGQFMPSFMDERKVRLKFDGGAPISVTYTTASDGSANYIFLESVNKIISKLKTAKQLKADAEFFQEGRRVMEFNVAGLKWD
jgi:hypothetical protein